MVTVHKIQPRNGAHRRLFLQPQGTHKAVTSEVSTCKLGQKYQLTYNKWWTMHEVYSSQFQTKSTHKNINLYKD